MVEGRGVVPQCLWIAKGTTDGQMVSFNRQPPPVYLRHEVPDGLLDGDHVGQDIVEDIARAEAGTLRLILDNDDIPVSVPDGVKTASRHVARQGLTSGSHHGSAGRFPW